MSKKFWKAALVRAARTAAEGAIIYIGSATLLSEVNWLGVISSAAMGGIISILMAIATGLPEVPESLPSNRNSKPKD